jgi:hypothetical protein
MMYILNNMQKPHPDFKKFIQILNRDVLPIYLRHEDTFDFLGIHGRMHISRSVIFSEWISRYYMDMCDIELDIDAIRFATAFHDSGRQGNGPDYWENDSSDICYDYLINKGFDIDRVKFISKLILKHGDYGIEKRIVHDADVLEIMRPCCGHGGRVGFKMKKLRFARRGVYCGCFFGHYLRGIN